MKAAKITRTPYGRLCGKYIINPVMDESDNSIDIRAMDEPLSIETGWSWIFEGDYEFVDLEDVEWDKVIIDYRTTHERGTTGSAEAPESGGYTVTIHARNNVDLAGILFGLPDPERATVTVN